MAAEAHWQWTPDDFQPVSSLPLADRGFRYGMAVFETLRVQAGAACFVNEHMRSLAQACRESDFPAPREAIEGTARFLMENVWASGTGVVRVHVTGGDGGPSDPVRDCRVFVGFEPRDPPVMQDLARGVRLRVHPEPFQPIFGGRKTNNYWPNIAARQGARRAGFDEALLFDSQGWLISASLGNVFLALDDAPDELLTPPASCGARRGVIRSWLLENWSARETPIHRETLPDVAEIIVTNSWIGLTHVREVAELGSLGNAVHERLIQKRHCQNGGVCW